jgi:hypothetical protein
MADITTALATLDELPDVTIEVKANLAPATPWVAVPHLYCNRITRRANGIDSAELEFQFGPGMKQIAGTAFADYTPLELDGQFVRITVDTSPVMQWVGVIVDDLRSRFGGALLKGKQTLTAVGLEWFLGRRQIDSAVFYLNSRLMRPEVFNGPRLAPVTGKVTRGNRDATLSSGTPVFDDGVGAAQEWTAAEMIAHLIKFQFPVDSANAAQPTTWVLDSASAAKLASYKPTIPTEGRTPLELLQAILAPSRGFCWWLAFSEDLFGGTSTITIYADTLAAAAVSLPGGGTLPANTRQFSLDFQNDGRVRDFSVQKLLTTRYRQVKCRGARMTSTLTLGFGDGTLDEGWTTAEETAYKDAASADADYGALAAEDQSARNDAVRRRADLWRAYGAFQIPDGWDQKSGDGVGTPRNWSFPVLSTTGSVLGNLPINQLGLRVLPATRLLRGSDYRDIEDITTTASADLPIEYEPPLVWIEVAPFVEEVTGPEPADEKPARYQLVDKLADADFGVGAEATELASYYVYALEGAPGFALRSGGGVAHTIAKDSFTGAEPTGTEPQLDYNKLRATLTIEADTYCEAVWPETPTGSVLTEELVVYLGEEYRLDFLPAKTMVGTDSGVPVLTNGGLLRDDREKLLAIAKQLFQWYSVPRKVFGASWQRIAEFTGGGKFLAVGSLLTTIEVGGSPETVSAVINEVAWDLTTGEMSVGTFADLPQITEVNV